MFITTGDTGATKTTSWKVVLPFYGYAAAAFLSATILLVLSATKNYHCAPPKRHNMSNGQ